MSPCPLPPALPPSSFHHPFTSFLSQNNVFVQQTRFRKHCRLKESDLCSKWGWVFSIPINSPKQAQLQHLPLWNRAGSNAVKKLLSLKENEGLPTASAYFSSAVPQNTFSDCRLLPNPAAISLYLWMCVPVTPHNHGKVIHLREN